MTAVQKCSARHREYRNTPNGYGLPCLMENKGGWLRARPSLIVDVFEMQPLTPSWLSRLDVSATGLVWGRF